MDVVEDILPSGVTCVEGPILKEGWEAATAETAMAETFGPKRKAEFLTGRTYARRALGMLGVDAPLLGANADRSPIWPEGVVGCITHTGDYCAVAVARQADVRGIGLDIESIGRVTDKIGAKVFTAAELAALTTGPDSTRQERMTAIFCAKEAFYKMQFPLTKAWVGFLDVAVSLEPEGLFALVLEKDVGVEFTQGRVFGGRYRVADGRVATFSYLFARPRN